MFKNDVPVCLQIVLHHTLRCESFIKYATALSSIDLMELPDGFNHVALRPAKKPSDTVRDNLRKRAMGVGDHRSPASQRFNENQPERFRPIDERGGIAQEFILFFVRHFAQKFHVRRVEQRLDGAMEVVPIGRPNYCRLDMWSRSIEKDSRNVGRPHARQT